RLGAGGAGGAGAVELVPGEDRAARDLDGGLERREAARAVEVRQAGHVKEIVDVLAVDLGQVAAAAGLPSKGVLHDRIDGRGEGVPEQRRGRLAADDAGRHGCKAGADGDTVGVQITRQRRVRGGGDVVRSVVRILRRGRELQRAAVDQIE